MNPGTLLLLTGLSLLPLATAAAWGDDLTARTTLSLKTPRSRDPVLGGSRDKVFFSVWVPDGIKVVRGAVCNPFSKDEGVSKHWKAACRHWQFAYLQTDLDAVEKDAFLALFKAALPELAKKSGHPEVEHMPLCFIGMSRGGGMSTQLAELMPERTLAAVPVCLEVGPTSEAGRRIPILTVFGEKDGKQMEKLLDKLPVARKEGARWAIAVQWNRRHEFALAKNLAFVFCDDVIRARLPDGTAVKGPVRLKDVPLEEGWLGAQTGWGKDGRLPAIGPWKTFDGREKACWFPSQRTAAVWQAFVGASADVKIEQPAGLGDKQPFALLPPGKPVPVKVTLPKGLKPTKVLLYDGDQRLAERAEAPWTFALSLKPGIHSLYAVVHESEKDRKTSRPHTVVVGE
jgi:hypothetical protein